MGEIRNMTKAELKQQERDQHEPAFLKWLEGQPAALERFLTEVAPDVGALPEPYSREGLRLAVVAARATFDNSESAFAPENAEVAGLFVRHFGEVYIRSFEGHWVNIPDNASRPVEFLPLVSTPSGGICIDPEGQFAKSWVKQTSKSAPVHPDGLPVWVFDNWHRNYEKWVTAGRPDREEWDRIVRADLLKRASEL
ncbi:hypothetical protein OH799_25340 [Nocardia sp. NBC_00881]|uniref:hypothetical protein n=1 Tax=Nocardia sp. NBC_00881 TaxID=2975995 RepID=UPI003867911F|nr:hypothetical protein OH799_25340 [Nocardia sp. NBC_00881]